MMHHLRSIINKQHQQNGWRKTVEAVFAFFYILLTIDNLKIRNLEQYLSEDLLIVKLMKITGISELLNATSLAAPKKKFITSSTTIKKIQLTLGLALNDFSLKHHSCVDVVHLRLQKIHFLKSFQLQKNSSVFENPADFEKLLGSFCDFVQHFEDPVLQSSGKTVIPTEKLTIRAIQHLREYQDSKKYSDQSLFFDEIFLQELLNWFKNEYMEWIAKPKCKKCGKEAQTFLGCSSVNNQRREEYFCCSELVYFYRYSDVKMLLQTRKGRCGEYASLFTFFCRCLGFDSRYIFCTEDHVWTEVYLTHKKKWMHIDPSEGVFDTPIMYEQDWKKKIKYVFAFSKEDIQDVTWRYSNNYVEVLQRRAKFSETLLIEFIVKLRQKLQYKLNQRRLEFLQTSLISELVHFLKP